MQTATDLDRAAPAPAGAIGRRAQAPLIAHVVYRLDMGGLENGLVNLINRIPQQRYRHAIVCMTDYSDFHKRIRRDDIRIFAMHKKASGNDSGVFFRLYRLFRQIRPDLVHSRNVGALDSLLPAVLAGVPSRLHGEHGRDVTDLDGSSARMRWLRRLHRPMVSQYIALSRDLESYLRHGVGVPHERIAQIYNGVDAEIFRPAAGAREALPRPGFAPPGAFVIGTVGRMQPVKDQLTLARAFVKLLRTAPADGPPLRLVMAGDGPLREQAAAILAEAGASGHCWLAGARDDIPQLMRGFDLFVLPSLAEGISNTVLEAMASGLPVIATAVGGNPELVEEGRTGTLVPPSDPEAMARAMLAYSADPEKCRGRGLAARARVERDFSMTAMVNAYIAVYDRLLERRRAPATR
jgi:sugar transferase (PEP-CTERM/EpsH1 system associated)